MAACGEGAVRVRCGAGEGAVDRGRPVEGRDPNETRKKPQSCKVFGDSAIRNRHGMFGMFRVPGTWRSTGSVPQTLLSKRPAAGKNALCASRPAPRVPPRVFSMTSMASYEVLSNAPSSALDGWSVVEGEAVNAADRLRAEVRLASVGGRVKGRWCRGRFSE